MTSFFAVYSYNWDREKELKKDYFSMDPEQKRSM